MLFSKNALNVTQNKNEKWHRKDKEEKRKHGVSLDAITKSVQGKFSSITVSFDRTQHPIFLIHNFIISITNNYNTYSWEYKNEK